ncbi:MAG: potassium-transporting ATPase subunit KdpC [Planctomycetes bacterium]|nr:potassium-transporting ATPase subunit KdpC [Planctomycetota bacterium]
MFKQLNVAARMLLVLSLLTGVLYPLLVTVLAQLCFHSQANGSLIVEGEVLRGSQLVGQFFDDSKFFWGRLSATTPPYNASASSGSNLGPTNPELSRILKERIDRLRALPGGDAPIPVDLVTASASGLDPDISPAAARFQIARVAAARGLPPERVHALVEQHVEGRCLGFLGEPRVNVLELNRALVR